MLLINQGNGLYKMVLPNTAIEGNLGRVGVIICHHYDITGDELELALDTAKAHGHDTMRFDLNTGKFLYSFTYWKLKRAKIEVAAIRESQAKAKELIRNEAPKEVVAEVVDRYVNLVNHADWENIYSCFDWLEAA